MKEKEMDIIGAMIARSIFAVKGYEMAEAKEDRQGYIMTFRESISKNAELAKVREEVAALCSSFPLYPEIR